MASTKATVTTSTAAKRSAPAPQATSGNTTAAQAASGTAAAKQAAPKAALFMLGHWPNVQQGSIRHYAQQVAATLAQANPKGFTLAAYKAALIASAAASTMRQPGGGWQGHNMPTWAANPRQAWLVPAGSK